MRFTGIVEHTYFLVEEGKVVYYANIQPSLLSNVLLRNRIEKKEKKKEVGVGGGTTKPRREDQR